MEREAKVAADAVLAWAIPVLPVREIAAAVDFYVSRLGFRSDHADAGYAILLRGAVQIHLWAATDERWRERPGEPLVSGAETFLAGTASARIAVSGIEALCAEMTAAGVMHPNGSLNDKPYGLREFAVLDLDGNLLTFFQKIVG